jgi:hypothetical protein
MVETITPVGHGGRRSRWVASVLLHALGAALAAGAFGAVLGAAGAAFGAPWGTAGLLAAGAVAALYALRELAGVPVPVPDRRKQVPQWWRSEFPAPVASFLYGLGLGLGFLTFLRHGTLVAVAAVAVASGDPVVGLMVMVPFGVARAVTVTAASAGTSSEAVAGLLDRLDRWAGLPAARVANGIALGGLAVVIAGLVAARSVSGLRELAAGALALVFAWAAGAKLIGFGPWARSLQAYGLGRLRGAVAAGVPLAESAVPALAAAGLPGLGGAWGLLLLVGFSGAVVRARLLQGRDVPCGCLGRVRRRDYRLLLARNAALAALAAGVALRPPAVTGALGPPGPGEALPAVLAALAVAGIALALRELARLRIS